MSKLIYILSLIALAGCAAKLRVTDVDGSTSVVKKIKPEEGYLLFRTDGVTEKIKLKTLHHIDITNDSTEHYNGETWIAASLSYKKTPDVLYSGWTLPTAIVTGKTNKKNRYRANITSISRMDRNLKGEPESEESVSEPVEPTAEAESGTEE